MTFLARHTGMACAIAEHDWASTPLGPVEGWPAALRIAVGMMCESAFPKALVWGPEMITLYNDAFIPILGSKHPCLGQPFSTIWSEAWDQIGGLAQRAYQGEATYIEDFPLVILRSEAPEEAFFTFCYSPLRDEFGQVRGMLDTVIETTGKVRAERLAAVRNAELVHRVRNVFSLVSVVVNQTHRNASSLEEAQEKIRERILSLDRAQDVLLQKELSDAQVEEVVRQAILPFQNGAIHLRPSRPDQTLGRRQVVALTLALHELGTNAMKYGALSVDTGHVTLSWGMHLQEGEEQFVLTWEETGGPPVTGKSRRGFGSFLVESALPADFSGTVTVDYAETGLRMQLTARPSGLHTPTG